MEVDTIWQQGCGGADVENGISVVNDRIRSWRIKSVSRIAGMKDKEGKPRAKRKGIGTDTKQIGKSHETEKNCAVKTQQPEIRKSGREAEGKWRGNKAK